MGAQQFHREEIVERSAFAKRCKGRGVDVALLAVVANPTSNRTPQMLRSPGRRGLMGSVGLARLWGQGGKLAWRLLPCRDKSASSSIARKRLDDEDCDDDGWGRGQGDVVLTGDEWYCGRAVGQKSGREGACGGFVEKDGKVCAPIGRDFHAGGRERVKLMRVLKDSMNVKVKARTPLEQYAGQSSSRPVGNVILGKTSKVHDAQDVWNNGVHNGVNGVKEHHAEKLPFLEPAIGSAFDPHLVVNKNNKLLHTKKPNPYSGGFPEAMQVHLPSHRKDFSVQQAAEMSQARVEKDVDLLGLAELKLHPQWGTPEFSQQWHHEFRSIDICVARYFEKVKKSSRRGAGADMPVAQKILNSWFQILSDAIVQEQVSTNCVCLFLKQQYALLLNPSAII